MQVIPLLLIVLVAFMLGLIAYGFWRVRGQETSSNPMASRDDVLLGFLLLAALALLIFLTYAFLGLQ